jgi:hypothetical protein
MMTRSLTPMAVIALGLAAAGCQDSGVPASNSSAVDLSNAFSSLPVGFSDVQNTFGDSTGTPWTPGAGGRGHHGGGAAGGGMMCGGLGGFVGFGLGLGNGHGLFGSQLSGTCAFDAASGRVACDPVTRDGLTVTRSAQYTDVGGAVQQAFDSATTNAVNLQVAVSGTRIRRDGDTAEVQHASDRTVSGLAAGSTGRTVNGTSAGTEKTAGSDSVGTFNAVRTIGDTIQEVVVPVAADSNATSYPTAGTIIRSMQVSVTYTGQSSTSSSRREVITFDGSNTAAVVVTQDGTTQNCTLALPHGRLTCS